MLSVFTISSYLTDYLKNSWWTALTTESSSFSQIFCCFLLSDSCDVLRTFVSLQSAHNFNSSRLTQATRTPRASQYIKPNKTNLTRYNNKLFSCLYNTHISWVAACKCCIVQCWPKWNLLSNPTCDHVSKPFLHTYRVTCREVNSSGSYMNFNWYVSLTRNEASWYFTPPPVFSPCHFHSYKLSEE